MVATSVPRPPNVPVPPTLLFTDIVGSTPTAHALGEGRWAELLTTHDQRMTGAVDRYRGHITKFTGDGILAIFDGAARAIRCALYCRTAAKELGLGLRIGVHTGEIESAGDEFHGLAVHEASRIMMHAGPGEVLISETTKMFARDDQLEFEERGEFELRGVDGLVRVFRCAPEGEQDTCNQEHPRSASSLQPPDMDVPMKRSGSTPRSTNTVCHSDAASNRMSQPQRRAVASHAV